MSASVLSGCKDLSAPREETDPLFASGLRVSKKTFLCTAQPGKGNSLRVSSLWLVSYYYHSEHVLGPQVLDVCFTMSTPIIRRKKMIEDRQS